MKKNQSVKAKGTSAELSGNRKRNTCNSQDKRTGNRKTTVKSIGKREVRNNSVSKVANKENKINIPKEITRIAKSLKAVCMRWEKADKENQRLLCMVLWGVPYRQKKRARQMKSRD